ncbi:unnamed protein product [Cyclocybe aegerita]|uniref:Carboxypeptidase n=1 Tax=Cyclocybe aegerita TaxID=1973307 RepID=A0A8S0XMV1_CYCAE|nr:unnamed protein product [Cyclocybe aegerita]
MFSLQLNIERYDAGLFSPVEELSILSEYEFTTLGHPAFPQRSVRIKKSSFCDGTVDAYTGYIDIHEKHLFFYFFESRGDPNKDDVVFWTNGGPGGSSSIGLFMELGPCMILDANGPKFNPYSWNSNANVFFVDQPAGVGFSYADYGDPVSTTEEAAKDIAAFVVIFFENFSKFKGRGFHLSGESYGGRYLPIFASEIYDQNAKLVAAGLTPINLTSIMIGNGLTDFFTMLPAYHDFVCTAAVHPPVLDIASCVRMKQAIPRCQKWAKESCLDIFDGLSCEAAMSFCEAELLTPYVLTGRNPYDVTADCEGGPDDICYPFTRHIRAYLDKPSVRRTLGVDPSFQGRNFSFINFDINQAFTVHRDFFHQTYLNAAALLERGVRVLVFVGANDYVCNTLGNERWTLDLDWSGGEEFRSTHLREWLVDGKRAGQTRSARGFTYATVEDAGHMVPYNKPKEALEMVNRWLCGKEL